MAILSAQFNPCVRPSHMVTEEYCARVIGKLEEQRLHTAFGNAGARFGRHLELQCGKHVETHGLLELEAFKPILPRKDPASSKGRGESAVALANGRDVQVSAGRQGLIGGDASDAR